MTKAVTKIQALNPKARNLKSAPAKKRKNPKITIDPKSKVLHATLTKGRIFGTLDEELVLSTIDHLALIFSQGRNLADNNRDLATINAAIAALVEIEPRDSVELMLATQMVTVHNLALEMSSRALLRDQTTEAVNYNISRVTKLMRTFTSQIEALNKYRTKGQQKITVQHVNVNDGGQAIVGDVKGDG